MRAWVASTFGSLQNRHFRVLWFGTLSAFVSFFMSTVAQAIVAFDLTGKNGSVGLVVGGQGVGQLLFGPVGGVAADRFPKRMIVLAAQATITATFAAMAFLLAFDLMTIWLLAFGSFMVGGSFGFLGPARTAMMMDYVTPERRGNAVALSQMALNASRVVGPFLVALLLGFDFIGKPGAYFVMAGLYALALVLTFGLPPALRTPPTGRGMFDDLAIGLRYAWQHPRLRLLLLSYGVVIMIGFPYVAVLPGLLENELGHDEDSALTWVYVVTAGGGLIASLVVASLADGPKAPLAYNVGAALFGATLIATGFAPGYATTLATMFVVGVGSGAFQTLNGALVAQTSAPEYFGRVLSLTFLAFAAFGIVAVPVGLAADQWGERTVLVAQGAIILLAITFFVLAATRVRDERPSATDVDGPAGREALGGHQAGGGS